MPKILVFLVLFLHVQNFAIAQDLRATMTASDSKIDILVQPLSLKNEPLKAVPLNQLIKLKILLKSNRDVPLKLPELDSFNAVMPAHRHGMVTKAKVKKVSDAEYLVDGVKLHMPGEWQFNMQFKNEKDRPQVAIPLKL